MLSAKWWPLAVVSLPSLVTAARLAVERPAIFYYGDVALADLEAKRVLAGHVLLGPYSRFGWHHLGPAWYAWLGVFRWVAGGSPLGLALGTVALHLAFALAVVAVAARLAGSRGAWVAAGLVVIFFLSFGFDRLTMPWNPYAVTLAALLLTMLGAWVALSDGTPLPVLAAASLTATFMVQTDISTIVVAAAVPAAGMVLWAMRRHVTGLGGVPPGAAVLGWFAVGITALAWMPPIIQQATRHPGNLTAVIRFGQDNPGPHHSAPEATRATDTVLAPSHSSSTTAAVPTTPTPAPCSTTPSEPGRLRPCTWLPRLHWW
jgi:hypothetical protein